MITVKNNSKYGLKVFKILNTKYPLYDNSHIIFIK